MIETIMIQQSDITAECWNVQLKGLWICKYCEFKDTPECSGKEIIKTGKNAKGIIIPIRR